MGNFGRRSWLFGCALALATCAPAFGSTTCDWMLFPTPNPYPSGNQLVAVAGTGPGDVWEAGASFRPAQSFGYALHWSGAGWTSYPQAESATFGGQFSGLAAVAPGDLWAVGIRYRSAGYAEPQATVEHWNGLAFATVPIPPAAELSALYGITAFGTRDVWAVGGSQSASGPEESYVIRWNGRAWNRVASPNVPHSSTNLVAIAGSSAHDVWSVGDAYRPQTYAPLTEHWNGMAWSIVPTPVLAGHSARLNAVVAISPADAWAVGEYVDGAKLAPLTEHWDGTAWHIVASPDPGGGSVFLLGAAADSSRTVWAVGELATGRATVVSYTMRWNGGVWRAVYGANVAKRPVTLLNGVAKIPGAGMWAVGGDASLKEIFDTVTERRTCSKGARGFAE